MRKKYTGFYHVTLMVLAQIAWMLLLGIWIYWYVSNYILIERAWDEFSSQLSLDGMNTLAFVGGIILLVGIWAFMSLTFRRLNIHLRLTNLYDNFIANVTHELKSPLSSIQLYLETMNSRDVPEEKRKEFIERMLVDTQRLNELINSILEIPKLEQKKVSHEFYVYNVNETMREIIAEALILNKIPSDDVSFEGSVNVKCVMDKNAIKIALSNLIDNAKKYSIGEPKLHFTFQRYLTYFVLEVIDEGVGIQKKEQKKIFGKFVRIYNKSIPNVKGTGLGLYWVREIIKSHGGRISVYSEGLRKGTKFRIEIPIYMESKKMYINKLLKLTRKQAIKREAESDE